MNFGTSTTSTSCLFCEKKSSSLKNQSTGELLQNEGLFRFLCKYLKISAEENFFEFVEVQESKMLPVCAKCTKNYKQLAELYTEFQELEKEISTVAEEFRKVVIQSSNSNGGAQVGGISGRDLESFRDRFRAKVLQKGIKGNVDLDAVLKVNFKEEEATEELPVDIRDMMEIVKEEPFEDNYDIDPLGDNGSVEALEIENDSASLEYFENTNDLKAPFPEVIEGPRRSLRAHNSKQKTETSKPKKSLLKKMKCIVKLKPSPPKPKVDSVDYTEDEDFNDKTTEINEDEDTYISIRKRLRKPIRKKNETRCKFCPSSFREFVELSNHYTTNHPNEKSFDCYKCPEKFYSRADLHNHIKENHQLEWAKRFIGQKGVPVTDQFRKRKKKYICLTCDIEFVTRGGSIYHLRQHESNETKTLSCTICEKMFTGQHNLDRHVALHKLQETKTEGLFLCKDCDQVYKSQEALDSHIMDIHQRGVVKFVCTICGRKFTSHYGFKKHTEAHTEKKSDNVKQCKHCPETFSCSSKMGLHTFHKHPEFAPNFSCSVCHKRFVQKHTLESHILTHSDTVKKYSCEICHERFKSEAGISGHKRSKHGAERLSCKICGKTYNSKSGLLMHTNYKHSVKEKSHVCTICNKAFHTKYKLYRHISHHGDARPFICEICGKGFKTHDNLYSHREFFHNAESNQRYSCDICGKTFSWSTSYRVHRKAHHPDATNESSSNKGQKTSKQQEPPCPADPIETVNTTHHLNLNLEAFNSEYFN